MHCQVQNEVDAAAKVVDDQWASVAHAHFEPSPAKAGVLLPPALCQPRSREGVLPASLAPVDHSVWDAVAMPSEEAVSLADILECERGVPSDEKH